MYTNFKPAHYISVMSNPFLKNNKSHNKLNAFVSPKKTPALVVPNSTDTSLFPELSGPIAIPRASTKFKDALNNAIEPEANNSTIIEPGWVKISDKKIEYGSSVTLPTTIPENLNDNMYNAIEIMTRKWTAHTNLYDDLHGPFAYANKFKLPPVYDNSDEEEDPKDDPNNCEDDDCEPFY